MCIVNAHPFMSPLHLPFSHTHIHTLPLSLSLTHTHTQTGLQVPTKIEKQTHAHAVTPLCSRGCVTRGQLTLRSGCVFQRVFYSGYYVPPDNGDPGRGPVTSIFSAGTLLNQTAKAETARLSRRPLNTDGRKAGYERLFPRAANDAFARPDCISISIKSLSHRARGLGGDASGAGLLSAGVTSPKAAPRAPGYSRPSEVSTRGTFRGPFPTVPMA